MNPTATRTDDRRHTRLNQILSWLTTGAAILTLALSALALLPAFIDPELTELASGAGAPEITIEWSTRIVAFLIFVARASVLAIGLFAVASLFHRFAVGQAFAPETGRLLRRFGLALLAHTLLGSPVNTLLILAATWHGPGEHMLTVGVGVSSQGVLFALTAALLIALGHVLQEAARLADDHRQIV